jgi:drug/metabolite transporter (DMT)-like permease
VGYVLVLLAGAFFCSQNLIVRVLFNPARVFGQLDTGGFVEPTLANSFLLLFMRTAVGVPLMVGLLPLVYRPLWADLGQLSRPQYRRDLALALTGGVLMFLYLALLYVSIGSIAAGIALALFFTFPVYTALLSWYWFGSRPSTLRWGIMAVILLGSALTLPQEGGDYSSWVGVAMGLASAVAYALYSVTAQKAFETFHPVPFTTISFMTTLVLAAGSLLIWDSDFSGLAWTALWVGGLLSAIATVSGHVLNNLGIRLVGATATAMVGAVNPALTALFGWLGLQEQLSLLQGTGIGLVTVCVALLALSKPR